MKRGRPKKTFSKKVEEVEVVEEVKEENTLLPEIEALKTRLVKLNELRDIMTAEGISRTSQIEIKIEQAQSELNKKNELVTR